MSVSKKSALWLAALSVGALLVARAQDFDALLQDLTLPSPTALSSSAAADMPDVEPLAAEESAPDAEPAVSSEAALTEEIQIPAEEQQAPAENLQAPVEDQHAVDPFASNVAQEPVEAISAEPPMEAITESPAEPIAAETALAPVDEFDLGLSEPAPVEELIQTPVSEPAEEATPEPVSELVAEEPEAVPVLDFGAEPVEEAAPIQPAGAEKAAAAVETQALTPDVTGLDPALVAKQEEVRRQAREFEGRQAATRGLAALQEGRLDDAVSALQEAQAKIPARPATKSLLEEVKTGLAQAHFRKAEQLMARADLKAARESLEAARTAGADVKALDQKLSKAEAREAAIRAKPVPVKARPEITARKQSVEELLREARQYYDVRDYNASEALYERVLQQDEYNVEAMRYLRKIDEVRYRIRSQEREATAAKLVQKVRDSWNTPIQSEIKLPPSVVNRGAVETQTSAQKLQEKMEKIIIPSIEFRQANIADVVNFLVEASIAGDKDGAGVNIILNLNVPGGGGTPASAPEASPAPQDDPFGFGGGDFGGAAAPAFSSEPSATSSIPTITLNLRRISLLDAIKYITEVARLKYRLEENAVMITPEGVVSGRVVTRLYPVQPSILDVIVEKDESQANAGGFQELAAKNVTFKKSDVKDFFEKTGVPFPAGTSITYNPTISQLIVANTPENLEVFERILARLNVIPNQVEIEARFVEISQDDLDELGFQWLLTDNWEIAGKTGPFGAAAAERIQMNADSEGITKGLRFFSNNRTTGYIEPASSGQWGADIAPIGSIARFASVLTNPEVSLIVQALSRHGGTDLLSAPRVTTRSGVNAQIQVVREIIYPTEFETTQPQFNESGNVTTPPVVTPGTFEKRETGVILNVTPTVGPDGYTIDLVMVPEVSELVDWIQYGSTISIPRTDPITGLFSGDQTFTFNIPQPVFSSRNVTTSIVIWDGQTVVMGGLIREDLIKVKDKIPLLGDIPVLGRLFRSEGEYSRKKNLLIFVTARLVDPSGKPINRGEALAEAEGAAAKTVASP